MIRVIGTTLEVQTVAPPDIKLVSEMREVLLIQYALTRAMLGDSDAVVKAQIPARMHAKYDAAIAVLRTTT